MSRLSSLTTAALLLAAPAAFAAEDPLWAQAHAMAAAIEAPRIPKRDFAVKPPRPGADARPAILAAIARAHRSGGGRVVLAAGTWRSDGPIRLQSRVELHLDAGATLLFSPDPARYLPPVKTRWEGTEVLTYSPLIYAADVEDVAVTGPGVIDGNADSGFHAWAKVAEPDYQRLRRLGFDGSPLAARVFSEGTHLRPPLIQIFGGKRILLAGYTARNSPFWVNHLVYADEATVRGLTVESRFGNNDGVDVESSTHVLVEDNVFRTGDDSVVIKSGRDLDGRRIGRASAWVLVRNNDMGGEDGIAVGSEMSGGVHDVFFEHNTLRTGASAVRFKANLDRGGTVERVRVRDMTVERFKTLIWFQLDYPGELGGDFPATYRDIVFEDVRVEAVDTLFEVHAPVAAPLADVALRDFRVKAATTPLVLENVARLTLQGVVIGRQRWDGALSATGPAAAPR